MKKSMILSIILLLVLTVAALSAGSSKPANTDNTVETTVQTTNNAGKPLETTQTTTQTTTNNAGKEVEVTTQTQTSGTTGKTVQSSQVTKTTTQSQPVTMGVERAFPGYLTDHYSGTNGTEKYGYDLYRNPARHSLANIRSNSGSGYGVFLRTNKNNFRYYKLNANGSKMAQNILAKTNRKENIYVVVKGSLGSDGVIYATEIKEVAHGKDKEKQMLKEREKEMNDNYNKGKVKQNNGKGNK